MRNEITVDMTPGLSQPILYYSQNDVGTELVIKLKGVDIPAGATITLRATKPSGFGFIAENPTVSGNTVTFITTEDMTDEYGRFPAELNITSGGVSAGTANFIMAGEKNPHPNGTIDGSAEEVVPELTQLVERVEDAASSVLDRQTVTNTLPAGSQASYSFDEETNTQIFGIPQGEAGAGAVDVTASAYSSSKTYAVGDYVIHNDYLYRCTTAITTAEAWTSGHWTQVLLANEVSDVKSDLSEIEDATTINYTGINIYHAISVTDGKYYNPSNGNYGNNDSYSAVDDYMEVEPTKTYVFTYAQTANTRGYFNPILYCFYDENKTFVSGGQNLTNGVISVPSGCHYIRVSMSTSNLTKDLMITKGTGIAQYEPYEEHYAVKKSEKNTIEYDGTTSLRALLDAIPATIENQYDVIIPEGEYDTLSWFTDAEKSANDFVGFFVPDYITLVGKGNRESVILKASFETRNKLVSVINLAGTSGLKNLTVIGTLTRYGVHDDFAYRFHNDETYERVVENCHFKGIDCYYQNAYGSGYKNGCKAIFRNCVFESNGQNCFGWHSANYEGTIPGDFTYENCEFISRNVPSLHFGGMASGLKHHIHLIGCKFFALEMREELSESGSGLDFDIDGYGNTKNVIETVVVTDGENYFTKFSDTVMTGSCAGTVAKGDLLYRSGAYFAKIGRSMPANRVCGVALENGTNNNPFYIKVSGIVPITLLGLGSVVAGNLIGVSGGVATVVTSGEYFAKAISTTHVQLVI